MIVRAYSCIVLLVSVLFFDLGSDYLHFTFSVFHLYFSCWTFWVAHQTAVHILLFSFLFFSPSIFSFLFFGTCIWKYWERLGFGWHTYWRLLFRCLFFLLIHIMWVLCFCYIQLIYTRFFARIHDLPYYTPALRSIVRSSSSKYNCNVDPSSTQLTPSDPETWSSPHRHRGSSYSGRCTTPYVCIHNISQMIFVIFMILLVQN